MTISGSDKAIEIVNTGSITDFGKCTRCHKELVALDYRNGEPTKCHSCKVELHEMIV